MKALLIVDIQNDFMPWGTLPVKGGDEVISVANAVMPLFDIIVASMDWHPKNHGSFASQYLDKEPGEHVNLAGLDQVLWPDHCVQNTEGAKFVMGLNTLRIGKVIYKGTNPMIDSYSAFFDNAHQRETGLNQYLKEQGITSLYVLGVATDYCVKFSVMDAINLGYEVNVIIDGCRGVNLSALDVASAISEMTNAGAKMIESSKLLAQSL